MATKNPPESQSNPGVRPQALKPEHIAALHDIVAERAQASLQEIADELCHRRGVRVCEATFRRALRAQGIVRLKSIRHRLRQQWRLRMGRSNEPTVTVIDAQSNRASQQGGESGFDTAKKVKGRKRNLVVDTVGMVIALAVTAASVQDQDAAAAVVAQACSKAPRLEKLYADCAYGGKCAGDIEQLHHIRVEVVRRPGNGTTGPCTIQNERSL